MYASPLSRSRLLESASPSSDELLESEPASESESESSQPGAVDCNWIAGSFEAAGLPVVAARHEADGRGATGGLGGAGGGAGGITFSEKLCQHINLSQLPATRYLLPDKRDKLQPMLIVRTDSCRGDEPRLSRPITRKDGTDALAVSFLGKEARA